LIDWDSLKPTKSKEQWMASCLANPFEVVIPGTGEAPDSDALLLAKEIVNDIDNIKQKAIQMMSFLCKSTKDWYFEGIEILGEQDSWRADYILCYTEEDYEPIGVYVGFSKQHNPVYVLQRIE